MDQRLKAKEKGKRRTTDMRRGPSVLLPPHTSTAQTGRVRPYMWRSLPAQMADSLSGFQLERLPRTTTRQAPRTFLHGISLNSSLASFILSHRIFKGFFISMPSCYSASASLILIHAMPTTVKDIAIPFFFFFSMHSTCINSSSITSLALRVLFAFLARRLW